MKEAMKDNKAQIRPAGRGFLFMIIACVVYLIWWFVNYYPDSPYSNFIGNTVGMAIWAGMFAAVFVLCLSGVILIVKSFRSLQTDRELVKPMKLGIICAVASVVLPILISGLRFITLDIFLIIWWAFLELCSASFLYGGHLMDENVAKRSVRRTLIYTVISLFLYIIYPFPPEYVRFWLGCVPIILYAADMTWMAIRIHKAC